MKKILFPTVGALIALTMVVGQYAYAATSAIVAATVTVETITVSVTSGTVAYGTLGLNTATTTIALGQTQTATNNGNVAEDLQIKGKNSTGVGAGWTLAAAAGNEIYMHDYSTSTGATWTHLTLAYNTLSTTTVPATIGTQKFDLKINTPTATTNFTQQSVDVTVLATRHY